MEQINKHILVVGGYGHVGQKIARRLVAAPGVRVTVAGRNAEKARAAAQRLGCGWAGMDIGDPSGWAAPLDAADIVICCIDTRSADLARAALDRGAGYIDISATDDVLRRIEALGGLAQARGALAVLSVGLAPGLSNLLARHVRAQDPQAEGIRIGVLLGLGDAHGPAAIDWTLRTLGPLGPSDIRPMRFGPEGRALPTLPFGFADQYALMRRGYPAVETRLALASPLVTPLSLRALSHLVRYPRARRLLARVLPVFRVGPDRAALAVETTGQAPSDRPAIRVLLEGRKEAEITALVAAEVALRLPDRPERGVRHMDELWQIGDFRTCLAAERITLHGAGLS